MTAIDPSIRPAPYQPGSADNQTPATAKTAQNAAAQKGMSLELAAYSQATAERTLTSVAAFQMGGPRVPHAPATSQAATAQLGTELAALESSQPVDIYAIMALVHKSAQGMRNTNREIRASELHAQVGELLSAANDMQKAANFRLAAGIVQGVTQMASGAAAVGLSMSSSPSNDPDAAAGARVNTYSKTFIDGVSGGIGGMGGVITAGLKFGADKADVSAKRHETSAKLHESARSAANEMMQQMMDVIRDVKDKLSAIDQSRIETNRGIARNI